MGQPDAGPSDTGPIDSGPDAEVTDGGICNPDGGIECDGDWTDYCSPSCDPGDCCSPQNGNFTCVPKDDSGRCPAADLWVDTSRIVDQYNVEWRYFPEGDCAVVEGCVDEPGWRRLLKFDTWTPNTGTADMYLGPPGDRSDYFTYSSCHDHYHFNTYAEYAVVDGNGSVAATGHKQAFCLLDFYSYPDGLSSGSIYHCGDQGIQRGWQDVYSQDLDCQWVDVTDVPEGDYSLVINLNTAHILNETNYSNNSAEVPIAIPHDDMMSSDSTLPCSGGEEGLNRACGFTRDNVYSCTPGTAVSAGCSDRCDLGSCTGDTILRICPGDDNCVERFSIVENDDSRCGGHSCGRGGDCCSWAQFTCPAEGSFTVLWAPYTDGDLAECDISVEFEAVDAGIDADTGDSGPPDATVGIADAGTDAGAADAGTIDAGI